jgi:hypothetical protein
MGFRVEELPVRGRVYRRLDPIARSPPEDR